MYVVVESVAESVAESVHRFEKTTLILKFVDILVHSSGPDSLLNFNNLINIYRY